MTCIVITNVQKNVIDFCYFPSFFQREGERNMSQVSHISFISNPEHLDAGEKNGRRTKKFHYAFVLLFCYCIVRKPGKCIRFLLLLSCRQDM